MPGDQGDQTLNYWLVGITNTYKTYPQLTTMAEPVNCLSLALFPPSVIEPPNFS